MESSSGKITLFTIALGLVLVGGAMVYDPFQPFYFEPYPAWAGVATTSVTVLNTAPQWAVDPQELVESSTSTPTNAGNTISFIGTAADSNNENYYLVVCKTSSTPTANPSAAPTCNGGGTNLWAVSISTASNVQATSTYTTLASDAETNVWYAFICDGNAANPQCNSEYKNGNGSPTSSPFYVNHRPRFQFASDTSPVDPGGLVTWTTSSTDDDVVSTADQVQLYVCRANDFTGTACGAGGTYCSSSLVSSNASCTSTLSSPLQDRNYNSFAYILDNHGFAAGTFATSAQATDTVLTVRNVAPSIDTSTVFLYDPLSTTSSLYLTTAQGQTSGFRVKFTVVDNNSCSSTFNFPEVVVTSTVLNLYRSGVTQASCQTSGNYNPNSCYPSAVGTSTWNYSCVQDVGSCGGSSDPDATFTCTFPLWYVADPTDGVNATDTTYFAENWLPSVRISDDNASTTSLVEGVGNELASYLAYSLNTLSINFGSLSPGSSTDPIGATSSQRTVVSATGNVGLDQTIYGDHMCTTYPTCSATSPTSTIQIYYQRFATSSVGYASTSAFTASSTPGTELEINIKKTTATSVPATGTTYWGIAVSSSITLAGDYTGQDTIIGIKGEAQFW